MRLDFDRDTLVSEISATDLELYLTANRWSIVEEISAYANVWGHEGLDGELLVPRTIAVRDFDRQVETILQMLAEFEGREPAQILTDMKHTGADVVRIRIDTSPLERGTMSLEKATEVIVNARLMLNVAARAAIAPHSYFIARPPSEVADYMETTRFGQTEPGSFIFTIISPVTQPRPALPREGPADRKIPYARQVTSTLAGSLKAIRDAAMPSERSLPDVFSDIVEDGVSANLCESLAAISTQSFDKAVEVFITWSGKEISPEPRTRIVVPATITSLFTGHGKVLKVSRA